MRLARTTRALGYATIRRPLARARDAFTEIFPPKVPRRATGRRCELAELVYPVTCNRATLFNDDIPRRFTTRVNTSGRVRYTLVHKAYARFGNGCKRAIDDVHRRYRALHSAAMTHFSDAPTRPRIPFGTRPRRADPVVLRLLRELRENVCSDEIYKAFNVKSR